MQVPAVQVRPPLQALPAQQGCDDAPHMEVQVPAAHPRPLPQTVPEQHICPSAPQPEGWQEPNTQAGVPPLQTVPHCPQLLGSVRRLDSQPLARLLSQSRKPAAQLQRPLRQVLFTVLLVPLGQVAPQAPQFALDARRSVSQPLLDIESQLPKLALHEVTLQVLAAQVAVATWGRLVQLVPQAPQLTASVARVLSQPSAVFELQSPRPAWQVRFAQLLATQLALATPGRVLQLLLQPLQFVAEVVMFTSQPSPVVLLQLAKPVLHEVMPQLPPLHEFVALAREQVLPHAPQFVRLVEVFTQALEQFVSPPLQIVPQTPFEQT